MIIRKATISDIPAVEACITAAYSPYIKRIGKPPGPMLENYAEVVAAHEVFIAIETETERIAGVLVLIKQLDALLLDNIAVHPDFQGQKVGRWLMSLAEDEAIRVGCGAIVLYTHQLMSENVAIYAKRGYVETHRVREKGFDRIYMRKSLGS